jgi:hypothetical protein
MKVEGVAIVSILLECQIITQLDVEGEVHVDGD